MRHAIRCRGKSSLHKEFSHPRKPSVIAVVDVDIKILEKEQRHEFFLSNRSVAIPRCCFAFAFFTVKLNFCLLCSSACFPLCGGIREVCGRLLKILTIISSNSKNRPQFTFPSHLSNVYVCSSRRVAVKMF